MKSILALLVLALLACSAFAVSSDTEAQFNAFVTKFGKAYTPEERTVRLAIFSDNLERIKSLNMENGSPVFGVTKFMDLTPEEFKGHYLNLRLPEPLPEMEWAEIDVKTPSELPDAYDWRNNGSVITPVKNQEQCGSCWAFSATETVESAWVLAGNSQQILAPQQIVDCDTQDQGCDGGYPSDAFEYIIKAGGLETEKEYPYQGVDGTCHFHKSDAVATIKSWKWVSQTAEEENKAMLSFVATQGPLSVCVDAAPWQYYTGGILKVCGMEIDHAVQAVGFASTDGTDTWTVRNSWGADWGEQGYIRLERGKNLCNIATVVTAAFA